MTSKYRELTADNKEVIVLEYNDIIDKKYIKKFCKDTFNSNHIGKKLNKLNNVNYITDKKRIKLLNNAKNNGFYMLNGFADCYRKSIKISYVTLYRRIYSNKDLLKTLISLGYIEIYKSKNLIDIKTLSESNSYLKVKVFYDKRFEFIKFIRENFLTEFQRHNKI